ncbi:MAG: HAMP domain-containing sensor histidine kinase [Dermatophilaceae bacterium]
MTQPSAGPSHGGKAGLAGRLLVAQTLVLLTGGLTAWMIAAYVGPSLFHEHLARAKVGASAAQLLHTERAYQSANAISLSVALLAALGVAMAVNVYITRRIGRSVATIAGAASDVAGGHYDVRVPPPGLGADFDALASGFNQMADRLGSVERTRRRLLADLGHEMRTPVATLEAYLEALEDGVATLDTSTVGLLRSQTRRLARLSDDIGAVSRTEEGQTRLDMRKVQPESVVTAAVDAAAEAYKTKDVRLVADVPSGLPALTLDPERIGQVLANLLGNALRHTPVGGTVTIKVSADARANGVALLVTDTGEGIPAEHLPHVFQRFYRVDAARDRAHGGSGIGLAIAKALVEAHDGQLTATSPGSGEGTTFRILLPG